MSVCSECGAVLLPNAKVCLTCGSRVGELLGITPQLGVHKGFVGTIPFWKVVAGIVVVAAGIVVATLSSSYQPAAAIIVVMGVVLVGMGAISAKSPVDRVAYQT